MKKIAKCLAILLILCLLLTSYPVPQQPAGNSEAQVENLAKLCKVCRYANVHPPGVSARGEGLGRENSLEASPGCFRKADSDEVNGILRESVMFAWGRWTMEPSTASRSGPPPRRRRPGVQADTGSDPARTIRARRRLTQQLSQLGPVPNIDRSRCTVQFNQEGAPGFQREKTDTQIVPIEKRKNVCWGSFGCGT